MGRYDKIRVWNGSSWAQPSRIRVWNGSSWQDYGANDSTNTNSIYVWNGSSWVRKTLNKTSHYVHQTHYLQYNGGAGVGFGFNYQFYDANYKFIVTPDGTGNYMMFEIARTSSSPSYYARFGFYNNGSTFYVYGKSAYNGSGRELNTTSNGNLAAGVKYTINYYCSGSTQYLSVYNHSSGATWSKSGSASRFQLNNSSGGSTMFAGYSVSGRNLYGKVWYAYVKGTWYSGNYGYLEYDLNNSPGGSSYMVPTQGGNAYHSGTIVDPSYTYYTWD